MPNDIDALKIGAAISAANKKKIQAAHDAMCELGAKCNSAEQEPDPNDPNEAKENSTGEKSLIESLIAFGDTVKSLDIATGRIGGYLVRWGSPDEPDISRMRDWFSPDTYFGAHSGDGVDVTLNHGIPMAKGLERFADQLLPPVKTHRDDYGLFAETVLDLSDEYQKLVHDLAAAGKFKWSSGALDHMVKRTPMKNGTNRIDRWIIGEAALTPIPAEPRLGSVLPLKSYMQAFTPPGQAAPDGAGVEIPAELKLEAELIKLRTL